MRRICPRFQSGFIAHWEDNFSAPISSPEFCSPHPWESFLMSLAVDHSAGSPSGLYLPEIPTPPRLVAFPISLPLKAIMLISVSACFPISYPTCLPKHSSFLLSVGCGSFCWVLNSIARVLGVSWKD